MPDYVEQAARWLSEDDSAYADMADARRAAEAMLGPALAEVERLRAEMDELVRSNDRLHRIIDEISRTAARVFSADPQPGG